MSKSIDIKYFISLIASIFIGITFIVSGSGKIIGLEEVPAQVIDFINAIIPDIFLTPETIYFIYDVFIPFIFPNIELILGLLLLIGFMPRFISALCLPFLLVFVGTNTWSILMGGYATCASCFGIWEKVFGALTPVQSLTYDIVLIIMAVLVIILYPGAFFSSRKLLLTLTKKIRVKIFEYKKALCTTASSIVKAQDTTKKTNTIGICLIIIGLILLIVNISGFLYPDKTPAVAVSNILVSDTSSDSASISWNTDKESPSSIQIYDANTELIRTWHSNALTTHHRLKVDGLSANITYYFQILTGNVPDYHTLPKKDFFTTLTIEKDQPVISKMRITYLSNSEVNLTWTTDKPSSSEIVYWKLGSEERKSISDGEMVVAHTASLTNLIPGAHYQYQIIATDIKGKKSQTDSSKTLILSASNMIAIAAPDFTLSSLDGTSYKLSNFQGKFVLLNFWMTSCSHCQIEMPMIQEVYTKIASEKMAIMTIHYRGSESVIKNFAISRKLTLPILPDLQGEIYDLYKVNGVPSAFLIDKQGIIRMAEIDFENAGELEQILKAFMEFS